MQKVLYKHISSIDKLKIKNGFGACAGMTEEIAALPK
jgi:hypothetical protein